MRSRSHLYLLDLLRGLASLWIVLFHYQGFYFKSAGLMSAQFVPSSQPLYAELWPLYQHPEFPLQLFFSLSGFVFFYQYMDAVRTREVSGYAFAVRRFARLYPLHLTTLLLVAAGQAVAWRSIGQFIVYPCNSGGQFILNMLLITEWLPSSYRCWSFNAPVWSVSVEMFLYLSFFIVAFLLPRTRARQAGLVALIVLASVAAEKFGAYHLLGFPMLSFFGGGAAYLAWRSLDALKPTALAAFAILGASFLAEYYYHNSVVARGVAVFPLMMLGLAIIQQRIPGIGMRTKLIGDISYSTYLLHFPLQLGLILLGDLGLVTIDYSRPASLISFMLLVVVAAVPTYLLFERPAQRWITRRLLASRRAASTDHATAIGAAYPEGPSDFDKGTAELPAA